MMIVFVFCFAMLFVSWSAILSVTKSNQPTSISLHHTQRTFTMPIVGQKCTITTSYTHRLRVGILPCSVEILLLVVYLGLSG